MRSALRLLAWSLFAVLLIVAIFAAVDHFASDAELDNFVYDGF